MIIVKCYNNNNHSAIIIIRLKQNTREKRHTHTIKTESTTYRMWFKSILFVGKLSRLCGTLTIPVISTLLFSSFSCENFMFSRQMTKLKRGGGQQQQQQHRKKKKNTHDNDQQKKNWKYICRPCWYWLRWTRFRFFFSTALSITFFLHWANLRLSVSVDPWLSICCVIPHNIWNS